MSEAAAPAPLVGLVIVSHVAELAEGVAAFATMQATRVRVVAAGGIRDAASGRLEIGTDATRIVEAIRAADAGAGVVVLGDLLGAFIAIDTAVKDILPAEDPELAARVRGQRWAAGRGGVLRGPAGGYRRRPGRGARERGRRRRPREVRALTGPGSEPATGRRGPVLVVGGGAVGSLVATVLVAGGERVVVLDRPGTPTGPDEIRLAAPDGRQIRSAITRADDPAACPAPDFAVFAVRMTELAAALPAVAAWPGVPVVTLENGLGAEEMALAALPDSPIVAGSLVAPVAREADGSFAWRKRRGLALAAVREDGRDAMRRIAAGGAALGLPVRHQADWRAMKWSKLLTNLIANATCAILGWDPAAVYADRRLFAVERRQVLEALATMRALGIAVRPLPGGDVRLLAAAYRAPELLAWTVLRRVVGDARGGKLPSLALHVAGSGGPSEAPWLNGGVARAAAMAGLPAPVNATLARLVEQVAGDAARRAELAGNRDALLAMVNHAIITGRDP